MCHQHDRITPRADTLVPSCPSCGAMALRAVRQRGAMYVVVAESSPAGCVNGHPFGPGRVRLGRTVCQCPPAVATGLGSHRTWLCAEPGCGARSIWPPCQAEHVPGGLHPDAPGPAPGL